MKKIVFFCLFISSIVNAQNIVFPDPNFKAMLVAIQSSIDDNNAFDINQNALTLDANSDGEIQVSEALLVNSLVFDLEPSITDITGIEYFANLKGLNCKGCSINTLDLTTLPTLTNINCSDNPLTTIDLFGLNLLQSLTCTNTNLTSLDLSNLPSLSYASCTSSQITTLDVTNSSNITQLLCSNNQLVNLDVSTLKNLQTLNASNNLLVDVILKNGAHEVVDLTNNPGLTYLCQDKNQSDALQLTIPTVPVNAYCSVQPGGDYNTFSGNFVYDADNNGCDASDLYVLKNQKLAVINEGKYAATFTNEINDYTYYADTAGTVNRSTSFENFLAFTSTPSISSTTLLDDLNNLITQDYCITANGILSDVEVVVSQMVNAISEADALYEIIYKNKGNQIISGDLQLNFDDNRVDLVSSSIVPTSSAFGNLNWSYSNLLPFESRRIELVFNVNSSIEIPPVNTGDTLSYEVIISPSIGDETPLDNQFTFNQIVAPAHVPNQILCLEGEIVPMTIIGNYIHYAIAFENIDTNTISNVVVKEIIDTTKYDVTTLEIINNSNPMYTMITGNIIEHYFENIAFVDHNHGNIILKIKVIDTLTVEDTVSINTEVYFDYEFPVVTSDAKSVFDSLINSINEFDIDKSIYLYPNPTTNFFSISSDNILKKIDVYDSQGRLIYTKKGESKATTIDLTERDTGIYYVKIISNLGATVLKIEKE